MRQLKSFATEKEAQALCDFLEVNAIETLLRSEDAHEVWVLDDDLLPRAEELLEGYKEESNFSQAAQAIREKRERAAKPTAVAKKHAATSRDSAGPLTLGMIVISIAVALLSSFGDTRSEVVRALLVLPIFEVDATHIGWLRGGLDWSQPWRLVSPMFIHFGIMHLVFNMMWLHLLGSQIENRHGIWALLGIAALAQLAGSILQFELSGPLFGGMSGVNYGLFGFVWMQSQYGKRGYALDARSTILLMGWLLLCATGLVGPVANACHAMGLVVGLLLGIPAYVRHRQSHETKRAFAKGSWEDLNIKGWRRFERLYIQPYVPFWFLGAALLVLLIDM